MGITYHEKERVFCINTPNTSYLIGVVDAADPTDGSSTDMVVSKEAPAHGGSSACGGYVGHMYYGKRIRDVKLSHLLRIDEPPYVPSVNKRDKLSFLDSFPMEYPTHGIGDFREDCMEVRTRAGHTALELSYVGYKLQKGKPKLEGLPATFGTEEDCETLCLILEDRVLSLKVELYYSTFSDNDGIARSVRVINEGSEEIYLTKVLSACLDMDNKDFELLTLHGSWARERHIQRNPVGYGFQGVSSVRGESSHQHHPFLGLLTKGATQEEGEVYGLHFVYSGNFTGLVYRGQFDNIRAMMGINGSDFCWKLLPGEAFTAPEVILTYSAHGLGDMTRCYHDLYRNHLIRSIYKDRKRPILINNWEATYFDFTTEKLLDIAKEASKQGIEMLVMDDGWFGNRCDDNRALGDWFVNEDKLKGGLSYLVSEVNKLGMKFGIWFEPEMISPDSDLYRAHPDWAIAVPGREAGLCRCQYVLDLTRQEIVEYVWERLCNILESANIEYVKWDMNRQLADLGSIDLPADRMGELCHRYVLAVYELQERLVTKFPDLLLENCSGGGARFDPGMLYYSPQIWCSDDTDAIERLMIQEGTALIYPLSCMGAHVSDCPNHAVGRTTPFETRGYVALTGTFGYELDITKIPEEDRNMIPKQVKMYHKFHMLISRGDYYRIASYADNHEWDCYMIVNKEKTEALLIYIQVLRQPNCHSRIFSCKGLSPDKKYDIFRYDMESGEDTPFVNASLYGETLMNAGIRIESLWGDHQGMMLHFVGQ